MKLRIEGEECICIIDEENKEIIRIEMDYDMGDVLERLEKLIEYINNN
jgi:hypothetical protein